MYIQERHFAEFSQKPQIIVEVPQIMTFFGTFAPYYKGPAISAAGGLGLSIAVSVSEDNQTSILNTLTGDRKRISTSQFKYKKEDKWANYFRGTLSALSDGHYAVPALRISFGGSLLSMDDKYCCSASAVGLATALNKICSLGLSDVEIAKTAQSACSFCQCKSNYDQILNIVCGKEKYYQLYDYSKQTVQYIPDPFEGSKYAMLCVNSNIPFETMREEFELMFSNAEKVMAETRIFFGKSSFESLKSEDLKDRSLKIPEEIRQFAVCMFEERNSSIQAVKSYTQSDCLSIGKFLGKNGRLLRDTADITCPELDWIAKRMSDAYVICSSSDCIVCAVCERRNIDTIRAKLEEYDKIFGFNLEVSEFVPSQGVRIII